MLGQIRQTSRGFEIVDFVDRYGEVCSLQQSSLAENSEPGTSAIWLGVNDHRMHLTRDQVSELIAMLQSWINTGSFSGGR